MIPHGGAGDTTIQEELANDDHVLEACGTAMPSLGLRPSPPADPERTLTKARAFSSPTQMLCQWRRMSALGQHPSQQVVKTLPKAVTTKVDRGALHTGNPQSRGSGYHIGRSSHIINTWCVKCFAQRRSMATLGQNPSQQDAKVSNKPKVSAETKRPVQDTTPRGPHTRVSKGSPQLSEACSERYPLSADLACSRGSNFSVVHESRRKPLRMKVSPLTNLMSPKMGLEWGAACNPQPKPTTNSCTQQPHR